MRTCKLKTLFVDGRPGDDLPIGILKPKTTNSPQGTCIDTGIWQVQYKCRFKPQYLIPYMIQTCKQSMQDYCNLILFTSLVEMEELDKR